MQPGQFLSTPHQPTNSKQNSQNINSQPYSHLQLPQNYQDPPPLANRSTQQPYRNSYDTVNRSDNAPKRPLIDAPCGIPPSKKSKLPAEVFHSSNRRDSQFIEHHHERNRSNDNRGRSRYASRPPQDSLENGDHSRSKSGARSPQDSSRRNLYRSSSRSGARTSEICQRGNDRSRSRCGSRLPNDSHNRRNHSSPSKKAQDSLSSRECSVKREDSPDANLFDVLDMPYSSDHAKQEEKTSVKTTKQEVLEPSVPSWSRSSPADLYYSRESR